MSVFANGLEVSGKATPNKTIAAMPDVCMSPPPPPAGPVPIPYPLTGMASDTTDGCTSVFVKGKEAGKKNASKYSKTTGDEPATNSFGAGVVSHKITSSLKFAAYSFDVILEGGGAERFTDITTQNHMNTPNTSVGMSAAQAAMGETSNAGKCAKLEQANQEVRTELARVGKSRSKKPGPSTKAAYKDASKKATITHGMVTPSGGLPQVVRACSRKLVCRKFDGMSQGLPLNKPKGRKSKASQACGGHVYKEARSNKRSDAHPTHTESRIIEDLFNKGGPGPGGGTLILAINWETGENMQAACEACQALLCAVDKTSNPGKGCLDIKICAGDPAKLRSPSDLKYCEKK